MWYYMSAYDAPHGSSKSGVVSDLVQKNRMKGQMSWVLRSSSKSVL